MANNSDNQNEITKDDISQTSKESFENSRISRRTALRRIGITTGVSAALLASDEFAQLVTGKLSDHRENEAIANTLSNSLKDITTLLNPTLGNLNATSDPAAGSEAPKPSGSGSSPRGSSGSGSGSSSKGSSGSGSGSSSKGSGSGSSPNGSSPGGSSPNGSSPGGSSPNGSTPGSSPNGSYPGSDPGGSTPGSYPGSDPGGSTPGSYPGNSDPGNGSYPGSSGNGSGMGSGNGSGDGSGSGDGKDIFIITGNALSTITIWDIASPSFTIELYHLNPDGSHSNIDIKSQSYTVSVSGATLLTAPGTYSEDGTSATDTSPITSVDIQVWDASGQVTLDGEVIKSDDTRLAASGSVQVLVDYICQG